MKTAATPYIQRLDKIEADLENQAYRIIADIQDTIINIVRQEQLYDKGIDGKGKDLQPYSAYTVAVKKLKGQVYDRTTLLDTGDFYEGMYITARDGKYTITSSDDKTPMLHAKYGKNIMLVTDENNEIINKEEILPRLIEWILAQLLTT